jgi:HAD superfamily hydrolase (TIGR01484 family)
MKNSLPTKWSKWSSKTDSHYFKRDIIAFDLDDTLTTHGVVPSSVIEAFERLQKNKIKVVIVTGRPAGWADALIKLLPLDGVVCENGAALFFWTQGFRNKNKTTEPLKLFWDTTQSTYTTTAPRGLDPRLTQIREKVLLKFKRVKVASDQFARLYDLAIDFAEEVKPPLSFAEAQKIHQVFADLGAEAKVSSIHVNGWFGSFSKQSGLRTLVETHWKKSLTNNVIYVGDSPNDSSLFETVGCSVGVANIKEFLGVVPMTAPLFVTEKKCSLGALEVIQKLIKVRMKAK